MFIEDDELRNLYSASSADHIQTIETSLLHLERHPDDRAQLEELLRAAHSLKGDSRMLGVKDAESIVHQMEDLAIAVKEGQQAMTGGLCDRLYQGLDAVRKIAREAVTGEPSGVSGFHVMAILMGADEEDTELPEATAEELAANAGLATPPEPEELATPELPEESPLSRLIEDEEMRSLYSASSSEHLETLEAGLIHLEKQPQDGARLKELLRAAHSLKGDSRMLGVREAEQLVHHIEEILIAVQNGDRSLSTDLCDRLYQGLDAVRAIAREAVTGEPAGVSVFHITAQLMGAENELDTGSMGTGAIAIAPVSEAAELPDTSALALREASLPDTPIAPPEPATSPSADAPGMGEVAGRVADYHIDTLRVEAPKLDALMTQAGELAVAKLRIARRTVDLGEVMDIWEEWARETYENRLEFDRLERRLDASELRILRRFYHLNEQHLERLGEVVNRLQATASEDVAQLDKISNDLGEGIRNLRLLPLSSLFNLFPRMVRDLAKHQGKEINLAIEGGDTLADKRILEEMKDPLSHILRNAIDHGIETPNERLAAGKPRTASIRLRGRRSENRIAIEITDDGRGLNLKKIEQTALRRGLHTKEELAAMTPSQIQSLIFAPGFSTRTAVTEISGRGVGLDVVRENVERLKGTIQVESEPGRGCTFRLALDTSLATTFALIVSANGTSYALPVDNVESMFLVPRENIFSLEGTRTIAWKGQPISVAWLADLLELSPPEKPLLDAEKATAEGIPCVLLDVASERLGLLVDDLVDRQDIVLKPQSKLLKRIRNIAGATILGNGEVCMVLSAHDLLKTARGGTGVAIAEVEGETAKTKPKVLLVEDSIPIRTQIKRILDSNGYEVTPAVDGLDGFNKLKAGNFDAVVSDVEMPNLDGLGLTRQIRQQSEYEDLPVILVTTLAKEEDKRRGAEAGANAYITKGEFDQSLLLETLRRLI